MVSDEARGPEAMPDGAKDTGAVLYVAGGPEAVSDGTGESEAMPDGAEESEAVFGGAGRCKGVALSVSQQQDRRVSQGLTNTYMLFKISVPRVESMRIFYAMTV